MLEKTLQRLKYVQRTGQGVDIIFREMVSMGKTYPVYRVFNDYMTMNYRMEVVADKDEGAFVVSFPELPGCITCGETVETEVANALDAKKAWLEAAMDDGYTVLFRNIPRERESV